MHQLALATALALGLIAGSVAAAEGLISIKSPYPAERVAIEFAIAAASQPNDVTDELFARMKHHWSEGQIVEITSLIAYFGFMNRFNDTMATPLEEEPTAVAEKHIAAHGWKLGKHASEHAG